MDEEVINDLYSRAKSKGYSKSREDFVKLLHNDSEVINDSYSYVKSKGYGKDINSFYNLIGKVETEPSTQKKKFVSDSSLEDGSSELPKSTKPLSDMPTLDQQGLESAMAKRQSAPTDMSGTTILKTDVKAKKTFERLAKENQKLSAEKKKYGDIFDKQLTTKPKAEESQYLKDRLSSIDTDLINKTEESVVPELEYQFGDLGFKFEETGALGDYVKVTAPNGKTSEISLDNLFSSKSKAQSEILQKFIKENTPAKGLFVLEKTMREQDKKFNSQKQVDESIKGITDDVNVLNAKQKQFIAKKSQFDKELNILGPNATKEQLDLLDQQRIALNDEMKSLLKEEEKIKQKSGRLSSAVGKYTINKSKQGGWFGGIQDAIARGQGKISAGFSNLMIDVIAETNPNEKMVAPEELKKQTLIAAKKLNIQGPAEGQSYKQWRASLTEDENDNIEDEIDDFVKKSMKSNTLPYIRIGAEEIFGDPETTKQWGDLKKQDFWGGAVLGLAESAPAMIGGAGPAGWAQRTAQMYAQVSDGLAEEMESNPEFKDVSENEKLAITLPIGITGAILEEFGLRNIKGSQGLINSLTLRALGKAGKGVTAKTFRELVENEVESAIARGAITITAAGAAEFETGAAQELADTSYKALYNEIKGKEMFDTPDSVQDLIENVAVAGAQEAVGGFILGVPTGVSAAYSEKGFLKMDDASFETFANMANDDKMQSAYIASLKNKIAQGELSVSEAKDQLNNYRNSVGLFRQLPDGLTTQEKKEAMNLLKEKRDLENYINGKDPALVVKQKSRITEINDSLTKLSENNAVQEQSTTEIPVQSETGVSEEVEGRTPEAKPEVVTEQVTEEEVKDFDLTLPDNKDNIIVADSSNGFILVDSETKQPIEVFNDNAGENSGISKPYTTQEEAQARIEEIKLEPEIIAEQTAPQTIIEEQTAEEEINRLFNDEEKFQADYAENKVDYFETEDATKKGFEKYSNYLNLTDPLKEYFKGGGVIYNGKKSMYLDAEKTNPISLDEIAELYHKAKADNSNPELVQAVEKALNSISNIEENAYRNNEYLAKIKQEVSSKTQSETPIELQGETQDKTVRTEVLAGGIQAKADVAPEEFGTQGLSEADLPGYDRTMSEVEGIVEKSKKRKVSESKIFDNVMNYITGSKIYEDATDVQREALVRDVRKRFGLKEKTAPSVNKLFGKIKDVKKVTMTEKAALIKQIKDRIKGAKDVIKKQKEIASQIADEVKELRTKGKITVNQAANIISKFSKVNLLNETSVSNFVDYISKVFADAEYDNKINIAKSKLAKAKQNIVTKLGIANGLVLPLQKLFSINPTLIPEQSLNRYLELLDMFSARQQVLNLEEKSVVTKDVQDILDEINNEQSLSDELADRFEASENKVFKDDVLDYAASIKNMLKNGEIDEKEAELMTKYKDRIVEKEERAKMTEEEIEAEKEILTKEIKKATVNPNGLPTRDEKELAKRFSRLIKGDAIKELTNTELKNVLKLIDNINNNYLPHYTQLMVEKMNDINNSKKLENAVEKSKPLIISKLYSEVKSLFTKKDAILEMIRRNPLFYIDQVLGDFKTKDIFNSILEKVAEGESNFTADFKKVKEKLSDAQDKVAKSFKLDANKVLESSFKMMTYAIQLEYDSNVGNKEVNPAAEYLKATIKHINDGKSQFGERDAEVLQKILDDYSDSEGNIDNEKLYNSFNSAEKNAIKTVREVNESLTEKAEYTAAIIRGQKINPLTNYIHLNVLHEHKPSDLTSGASFIDSYNNSIRPSTKAKSLIERTGKVSPLNFDIFSSAEKGAKFVLMDYNLTEPIRTARKTINRTISNLEKNGKMSKKNRQVINAINAAVEESIDNLLVNAYTSTSVVDDAVNYISKQGYRSVLAGTGRFVSEFLSNVGFIIISDPNTFTEGIKNMGVIMSADAPQIMQNVNSKETNRIFPSDMLSGRMIDTSVLNQASGVKGATTKNAVLNKLEQFWNRTGKKYKNGVELTADFLISTPDKAIMRPIWFGSFANQFEKITGKKVDFKKIAENDEAYMEENREAIDQAKNIADERSVITGASSNAFTGILKGTVKPDQSTTVKAFNNFNNFMSKFLIYEYVTARTGIYAAMGNGSLTRKQGAALLGAVTTRMTVYSLLTKALGAGIIGLLFDDEEEEDKAIEKTTGQALASTFTSLILGRDFGNAPKTLINYGVERMNEEYLQALREGDYDPYKDSLQYTALPIAQKGKQVSIDDLITRMSGSFGPAANTANLVLKKMYEPEKKEADAIERSEKEKNIRVPLEIAGNLGFVPLYKEIRQTVMKDIYEDLQNPMLRIERLKKTNPELYERFKKLQAKGLDKKFQAELEERRKRMEERLKKKIEEQAKKD